MGKCDRRKAQRWRCPYLRWAAVDDDVDKVADLGFLDLVIRKPDENWVRLGLRKKFYAFVN